MSQDDSRRFSPIPAASIGGINVTAIRAVDPSAAKEIERIGAKLAAGTDSDADVLRLCQLLLRFGETQKAEAMLSASVDDTDAGRLFRATFPGRISTFESAIDAFKVQFSVILRMISSNRVLHRVFQVQHCAAISSDPVVAMLKRVGCEVDLRDENGIVGDVQVPGEAHAIPMIFAGATWTVDLDHVGAQWLRAKG